jgi:hypothetical protein
MSKRQEDLETLTVLGYEDENENTTEYDSFNGDFNMTVNSLIKKRGVKKDTKPVPETTPINIPKLSTELTINNSINSPPKHFYYQHESIFKEETNRLALGVGKGKLGNRILERINLLEELNFIVDQIAMVMLKQNINFSEIVSYLMSNKHLNVRISLE